MRLQSEGSECNRDDAPTGDAERLRSVAGRLGPWPRRHGRREGVESVKKRRTKSGLVVDKRVGVALVAGLLGLGAMPGCAHMNKQKGYDPRSEMTPVELMPPNSMGATVRSQDARRLGRRQAPGTLPQSVASPGDRSESTQIAWSGPRRTPQEPVITSNPRGSLAVAPEVAPLPEPPVLPAELVAPLPTGANIALASTETFPKLTPPTIEATAESGPRVEEPPIERAVDATAALRQLVDSAQAKMAPVRSYQARMLRQERVGESLLPAEELVLCVRREPFAVRLEWPAGTESAGREVIYSTVETSGKMQIRTPGSLVPRLTLSPESPLVQKMSRHPITEAGFDALLTNLSTSVSGLEGGRSGNRMTLEGPIEVAEVGRACQKITEMRTNGETWVVCLDAESLAPVMVKGTDARGQLLESYLFLDVKTDVAELATVEAFDPEKRWGGGGLLGRLARSAGGETPKSATSTR